MKRKVLTLTLGALLIVGIMAPAAFASWGVSKMEPTGNHNSVMTSENMYVERGDQAEYGQHMFNWGEYRGGENQSTNVVDTDRDQTWLDHFNTMQQYNYQMDSGYMMMGDSTYNGGSQSGYGQSHGMMGR